MSQAEPTSLVLIADDTAENLELLFKLLTAEGLDVSVASDGHEVLRAVSGEAPDLILLDVIMPGIDGFETCSRLKSDPATRDIPVIFMTSLTETHYRVQGFSVGAVDYVTKPFERQELLARVRTQISLRRASAELVRKNARLAEEIEVRSGAERALAGAVRDLERLTQELRCANAELEVRTADLGAANARLSEELRQRERAEAARAALQGEIIAAQQTRLTELSTPLIPITDNVLVMPLVGTMDIERGRQAVEMALRGAGERGADHLIIDITGVRSVDETVARMLVQAARGLALLGTRTIITGIRPEVARTLTLLEILPGDIVTRATLQAGVAEALRARRTLAGAH